MKTPRPKRIAVLGAGPIGLEAALYALRLGHDVRVYEAGSEPAAHVASWGFVRLFSPWRLNASTLGLSVLRRRGDDLPRAEEVPTGREFRERYLLPIAGELGERLELSTKVLGVARSGLLKGEAIGSEERAERPFRILLERGGREETEEADIVFDATGVYGQPCWAGAGGLPAPGEKECGSRIERRLPDVLGEARGRYADRRTILLGCGYSAATALLDLARLREEAPDTQVAWVRRKRESPPFRRFPGDPLPERDALAREANRLAERPPEGFEIHAGFEVDSIESCGGDGLRVRIAARGGREVRTLQGDGMLALVGYRPDTEVHRELQVYLCYATEGPMRLAALLLGAGTGGDCLAGGGFGAEALRNPEPGYFILGHKSYGRRSDFLLARGREQIRDAFRLLEGDPALDLYLLEAP